MINSILESNVLLEEFELRNKIVKINKLKSLAI